MCLVYFVVNPSESFRLRGLERRRAADGHVPGEISERLRGDECVGGGMVVHDNHGTGGGDDGEPEHFAGRGALAEKDLKTVGNVLPTDSAKRAKLACLMASA